MGELARTSVFDLALVFGYTLGAFLIVSSVLLMRRNGRDPGIALIRFLGGLVIVASSAIVYSEDTFDIFPVDSLTVRWSLLTIAGTIFVAVAIGELVVYRIASSIDKILLWMSSNGPRNWAVSRLLAYGGTVAVVIVSAVVSIVVISEVRVATPTTVLLQITGTDVVLEATYSLPGNPMDLVFRGESDGYITLSKGQIIRFDLPEDPNGELLTRVVTDGITSPRGLAIIDDVLYVVDLGPMPCTTFRCQGSDVPGMEDFEGEATIIEQSNGSVLAFDVLSDGALGNKRTILTGLPAVNFAHGAQGLTVGPDGMLYMSIGGFLFLYDKPALAKTIKHTNIDLLGKIVRFEPDGSGFEIFAEGFRNVYGLAFDEQGQLWGVDNDGLAMGGWRREEILQIKHGANYGYPTEGSFGPHQIRDDHAVWITDAIGSAGIQWAGNLGMQPGLVVGTCANLRYFQLKDYPDGRFVFSNNQDFLLAKIPGCATIVEPGPDGHLIIGVFDTGLLYTFTVVTE